MKSLNKGGAWAGLVAALTACLAALASDFHLWYDGPGKAALGMLIGAAVVYYNTQRQLKAFAEQGDDIDDCRE